MPYLVSLTRKSESFFPLWLHPILHPMRCPSKRRISKQEHLVGVRLAPEFRLVVRRKRGAKENKRQAKQNESHRLHPQARS